MDRNMDTSIAPLSLTVIFDSELNAYDAALSEGWPLPRQRMTLRCDPPAVEPFSAFLLSARGIRAAHNAARIAA
jgi:hypothetical protein